jgi:hypothetical protein
MSAYGCFNRKPFKLVLFVQDGYQDLIDEGWGHYTRKPDYVKIDNRATYDCQYTRSKKTNGDPQCTGCKWKSTNPDLEQ